ncbi:MAG: hypothetical protein CMJ52_08100 [Planctomycetaceae bacterium]|nr:hypothetical protein [Planctomycetaceae bacterium]
MSDKRISLCCELSNLQVKLVQVALHALVLVAELRGVLVTLHTAVPELRLCLLKLVPDPGQLPLGRLGLRFALGLVLEGCVQQGLGVLQLVSVLSCLNLEPLIVFRHGLEINVGLVQLDVEILQLPRVDSLGSPGLALRSVTVPLSLPLSQASSSLLC